jgi:uncharacterized protein involved in exopolysaccharide biosynthesis
LLGFERKTGKCDVSRSKLSSLGIAHTLACKAVLPYVSAARATAVSFMVKQIMEEGPTDFYGREAPPAKTRQIDTVNFRLIADLLLTNWRVLAIGAGAGLLLAILYLHLATFEYTVTMQVTPVDSNQRNSLTSKLGGMSDLAGLAGISLGTGASDVQLQLYLASLQSTVVAQDLVNRPEVASVVFKKVWDPETKTFKEPHGVVRFITQTIKSAIGLPVSAWQPPDGRALKKVLDRNLVIDYKRTSPVVEITYRASDKEFGRRLLMMMHQAADHHMRERATQRSSEYIKYLTEQLKIVTSTEERQALIATLTEQETLRMAAMADVPYSVDVLVPPTASLTPTSPAPVIIILTLMIMGAIAGGGFVLWKTSRQSSNPSY